MSRWSGAICIPLASIAAPVDSALIAAVHNPARTPKFVARDPARHPVAELSFFGLRPNSTVVEIWPGGGYWSEILGPYLAAKGTYYIALPPNTDPEDAKDAAFFKKKVASDPAMLGHATLTVLGTGDEQIAPPGSADLVLTFRNVHNWMYDGVADQAFQKFFAALKPGGILGVEEHRGDPPSRRTRRRIPAMCGRTTPSPWPRKPASSSSAARKSMPTRRDTRHWPKGVWTLPPSYALGEVDKAKYTAIGEADNFVLKFRKPFGN